jgi:hypothetical protein
LVGFVAKTADLGDLWQLLEYMIDISISITDMQKKEVLQP